ncbi:MAG: hypothetical protein QXW01_03775 [Candidatus Aenigmatarchaeota archaeon]
MKQLFRAPAVQGSLSYQLEKGQFGLFLIRFEGTNATGQAVSLTDLGNVIVRWNGQDIVNVDFEFLNMVSGLYGGFTEFSSTTGGAFKASAFIPTGLWFDTTNIYDIGDEDKVEFVLNWTTTKIASGSVYIFGKPRQGIMSYIHGIYKRTIVSGGSGDISDSIPVENITQFYIKNPTALINNIQVARDGKVIVDGAVGALQSYSDWIHLLEASSNLLAIEFVESKDIRDAVSTGITYKINTTGAGNVESYYSRLIPRADKVDISLARATAL